MFAILDCGERYFIFNINIKIISKQKKRKTIGVGN